MRNNTPKRKLLTRLGRLVAAKEWIAKYKGMNLISGYAKWFGVDKICALNELKTLRVPISVELENKTFESHKRRIEQKKIAKGKIEIPELTVNFCDYNFAFIAGFTAGGFPYGVTIEELEKEELVNNDNSGGNTIEE